jgi:hypothetical protein
MGFAEFLLPGVEEGALGCKLLDMRLVVVLIVLRR